MSTGSIDKASGPIPQTGTVQKAYYIEDFDGFDFLIEFGLNNSGDRVVKQQMRLSGTADWFPFIEALLEFGNYVQDTSANFRRAPKDEPPPPPLG